MAIFAILLALLVIIAPRAFLVSTRKRPAGRYWQRQRSRTPDPKAIRLVVLGDSIAQGVGATTPQKSFVGLAAAYITRQTGRPVHIGNYSKSGASAHDILEEQLPQADLARADIIVVEVGVNDSLRRTLEQFQADIKQLIQALPLEKTVMADLPFVKFRRSYQKVLLAIFKEYHIKPAVASKQFVNFLPALNVTAGDFWHPNDKGYQRWFEAFRPGIDTVLATMRSKKQSTNAKTQNKNQKPDNR